MSPKIENGSFFIASSLPFILRKPKIGDIVLFKINDKNIVKRIIKIESNKYIIEGENKLDSKKFGPLAREDILGKLILKF